MPSRCVVGGYSNLPDIKKSIILHMGVQGWRSGESIPLPPMWPGLKWVEFVGSLLFAERFSRGTSVSPLLKNQN